MGHDGPEMVQTTLRLSKPFLDDINATWKELGFNFRCEFIRNTGRDALTVGRGPWLDAVEIVHDEKQEIGSRGTFGRILFVA